MTWRSTCIATTPAIARPRVVRGVRLVPPSAPTVTAPLGARCGVGRLLLPDIIPPAELSLTARQKHQRSSCGTCAAGAAFLRGATAPPLPCCATRSALGTAAAAAAAMRPRSPPTCCATDTAALACQLQRLHRELSGLRSGSHPQASVATALGALRRCGGGGLLRPGRRHHPSPPLPRPSPPHSGPTGLL